MQLGQSVRSNYLFRLAPPPYAGQYANTQCFYRLANSLTEEKQTTKAIEVLQKAEQTISLKLWPVDYQSILMAQLYARNGQKQLGENRFKELAASLEEQLAYFGSFPTNQKKSIVNDAGYQLSLYNELISQTADTLSETEIKSMKKS